MCPAGGGKLTALKTSSGNYVAAVNGGGVGGPNDQSSPIHTDATVIGPWEQLTLDYDPSTEIATFKTLNGEFLTAVNGGGFGEPKNSVPIHTDAVTPGPWETFAAVDAPPAPPPGDPLIRKAN